MNDEETRHSLEHLAQMGDDELLAELHRALPHDNQMQPPVSAFQSSI